jgi:hypothetical protein
VFVLVFEAVANANECRTNLRDPEPLAVDQGPLQITQQSPKRKFERDVESVKRQNTEQKLKRSYEESVESVECAVTRS